MYRLGHRTSRHYLIGGALLAAAGLLITTGVVVPKIVFQPHTVLHQTAPVVQTVLGDTVTLQHVAKSFFELDVPVGWHAIAAPPVRYTVYSWSGARGAAAARRLDVYIDNIPFDLAVNRLQPVQADGDHFDTIGTTSDNCTSFTPRVPDSVQTGSAPSKWSGVNFLCDEANYERDVVATGSTEGVNIATLTGVTTGSHRVLLVYTDSNPNPDYTIFAGIINSFRLL